MFMKCLLKSQAVMQPDHGWVTVAQPPLALLSEELGHVRMLCYIEHLTAAVVWITWAPPPKTA